MQPWVKTTRPNSITSFRSMGIGWRRQTTLVIRLIRSGLFRRLSTSRDHRTRRRRLTRWQNRIKSYKMMATIRQQASFSGDRATFRTTQPGHEFRPTGHWQAMRHPRFEERATLASAAPLMRKLNIVHQERAYKT